MPHLLLEYRWPRENLTAQLSNHNKQLSLTRTRRERTASDAYLTVLRVDGTSELAMRLGVGQTTIQQPQTRIQGRRQCDLLRANCVEAAGIASVPRQMSPGFSLRLPLGASVKRESDDDSADSSHS